VFDVVQAAQMAAPGVVAHMGVTTKGVIGAHTARTLDQCVDEVQAIADAARRVRGDVIILCHGGPIAMPDDAQYVLSRTRGVDGFYGASSMERLPIETALTEQVRRFKEIRLPKR
jgi:predicted TIM-barrel enzyme